jgi:hypothetical protein
VVAFNWVNQFMTDVLSAVHNFASHSVKIGLTNTAPVATNSIRGDLTELATSNGYTQGAAGLALTLSLNQTGAAGTARVVPSSDITITSATGSLGPFRYVFVFNDTPTSPADPLLGWYDYGSAITLNGANAETFTTDFNNTNTGGLFGLSGS